MRIAEFSESSNLRTQTALSGNPGSTPLSGSTKHNPERSNSLDHSWDIELSQFS